MAMVLIWLLFAIFSAIIASNKGRSSVGWFFIGLLFGPFGLLVGFLSNLKNETQSNSSYIQDLKALSDLKDSGVINAEEFKNRKTILDRTNIKTKNNSDDNSSLINYLLILGGLLVIFLVTR